MGNSVFTQEEIAYLTSLPAVRRVTGGRITYTKRFKMECVRRNAAGESPAAIFRESGLGPELIGYKRIERCMARWRQQFGAVGDGRLDPVADDGGPQRRGDPTHAYGDVSTHGRAGEQDGGRANGRGDGGLRDMIIVQQSRRIDELEDKVARLQEAVEGLMRGKDGA
ncbi:hypothetical protein F7D09_1672 [Bifidobacterium leontopitheci]|uniref:Uncharacterized protein n=2 Tax=Bifidobacterium leontopitheci TaxID=2650774 RepID=A0A6I1GK78_9BIFI|nr:hypothetical protein F7D09_1672 [Bifidobacterium leontopitheci]